ncbi:MAG: ornithine carbamoyltransferase [Nitrospirae bacterium]|nr:ornithine carbamoyltransferase [Nitrospirota bacterium]
MKKRDFLTTFDLSSNEISEILHRASAVKLNPSSAPAVLAGGTVGMLFDKSSTRTRVSFEVGINRLGGNAVFLTSSDMQLGRGETVADTARVLSRYLSAMVIRTYAHRSVEEFASHAKIPVINALTDLHHPCQALADMLTIQEHKGGFGVKIAYIGDGNNVVHSLVQAAARLGSSIYIACPEGHEPDGGIIAHARASSTAEIVVMRDPVEAARNADVLYTDTWVSMGQESETAERERIFHDYQINDMLLSVARPDCIVMHCLPAHRGQEITDSVMDGPRSVVFDQAENRLHAQMALMEFLLSSL